MKELKVSAIENGTVIDHIPPKSLFQVIKILNLEQYDDMVLFGNNLDSKKYNKKAIIKISNKFFKSEEINKIALVAPNATLIEIKNFQIVKKTIVELPNYIEGIAKCFNPNCITNVENITPKLYVVDKDEVKLQCHYCEKFTDRKNLIII